VPMNWSAQKISPRAILVLQLQGLGDLIFTLPLFQFLRRRWPQAAITAVVPAGRGFLLDGLSQVEIVEIANFAALARIRFDAFDLIFDVNIDVADERYRQEMQRLPQSAVGFSENTGLDDLPGQRLKIKPRHAIWRQYLALAEEAVPFTGQLADWSPQLPLLQAERSVNFKPNESNRLIVLAPGASDSSRQWPRASFRSLADSLFRPGIRLAVVGYHSEKLWDNAAATPHLHDFTGAPLADTLAVLSEAELVVGNDTGLLHCAAALGRPVVGLYGPGDAIKYQPLGDNFTVIWMARGKVADISVNEVTTVCQLMEIKREKGVEDNRWSNKRRLVVLDF